MSGAKKMTVKSLSEELEVLKDQMKEFIILKETVKELKEEIKVLKSKKSETKENGSKCRKCDDTFNSKINLMKHISEIHPHTIECKYCEQTFRQNCELEMHIKTSHKQTKEYKCEKCNKIFLLKWRLSKHEAIHDIGLKTKICHYFNNNKACPYEELGCMFAHIESDVCKFKSLCSNKLCSYKHSIPEKELNSFECQQCELVLDTHNMLINHVQKLHVEKEKIQRDHLFPLKCPNCPKWIYTDDDNESHYDDFEEFGQCETRKKNSLEKETM